MEGHGEHATEGHREADLRTAPGDDLPSHLAQPAQGELDADGKEQQDDADFRQALDLVHVRHQAERSEEHTSELQSRVDLVCRLLLEKKKHAQRWAKSSNL